LSFEFPKSFCIQFRASRYIMGLNRTSKFKVIVVWICSEFLFSIMSVSIYYETQSDIRAKSYCRLHLLRASIFNFEHLNILLDSIGHPSLKQLLFEFATSFRFQFWASRYITGLNRTSKLKVIVVRIRWQLLYSISSVSIYYRTQSDIRVKSYCPLHSLRAFIFNYERLDMSRESIGHPS